MKRSTSILLFFIILQAIFTGCSSLPSEPDARKALEEKIIKESEGNIVLLEFNKTNGIKDGEEGYTLEFNALIEFKERGSKSELFGSSGYNFSNFKLVDFLGMKSFEKGSQVKLEGKIYFEKTENGWRPHEEMQIKSIEE